MRKEDMLTQAETEERVGFAMTTLFKWCKRGMFPMPLKPGGKMGRKYYRIQDIEAWEKAVKEGKPYQGKPE